MRVGFVGPFGDSNFGDYGMLINNIYDIKAKDITIFSYNIPLISKLAQKYLNNYNLSLCEVNIVAEPNLMVTHNCKEYAIEYNNYPDTPFEILKKNSKLSGNPRTDKSNRCPSGKRWRIF